jgi:hypothetical protein
MPKEPGQLLREAWIAGVIEHYPGPPPPRYITPWGKLQQWERDCAATVESKCRLTFSTFREEIATMSDQERGEHIAIAWTTEIRLRVRNPKPTYLTPWEELPEWQQKTDIGIFYAIENAALDQSPDGTAD